MPQPDGADLQAEAHVLQGRQVGQQIVGLEDEAGLAPQPGQGGVVGLQQLFTQHPQAAALGGPQAAEHGQQGGLARAGGAGEDHDLAGMHGQVDVGEHLLGGFPLAEPVVQMLHFDPQFAPGVIGWPGCSVQRLHQKMSAGSSRRSLPVASQPDPAAIVSVRANTATARWAVMAISSEVELASTA